jgi:phosphoribosylamine---glycine ligase
MKILIIGGGGREHALAWKIRQSPRVQEIFCAPGNPGIASLARCVPLDPADIDTVAGFAAQNEIDLTVVGPELPLTRGIADAFTQRRLRIFGPSRAAAEIEGSKAFAKAFLARHGIPTAKHRLVSSMDEATALLRSPEGSTPVVLKVDGLAAGKGVLIAHSVEEAERFAHAVLVEKMHGSAGDRLVIEAYLEGVEASFFALSDGRNAIPMGACQDYKQLAEGDSGPNTGGMGAISPPGFVNDELASRVMRTIIEPTLAGLKEEGRPYRGVLYAGLMLTSAGPKVLEFNARFGDPETQVLMPRLESDLVEVLAAAADGDLTGGTLAWKPDVCACVVMASSGYPGAYERGFPIARIDEAESLPGLTVFQAGTRVDGDRLVTHGGRVLGVSALGPDLPTALDLAYRGVDRIDFRGATFRPDIGHRANVEVPVS